ncbi:transcriptional regulator [Microbacterium sp.]|uniref:transcriptional regulator n=1 Tax=Microbacterium sp. TaxID=51671 RepID=UPI0039E2A20C
MAASWNASRDAHTEASRLFVERAHEELISGNLDDQRLQQVRPLVRESWERSIRNGVCHEGLPAFALAAEELERYRLAHPLASVMDMIRALLLPGESAESEVIVAVGDQAGRLLWVEGDLAMRLQFGEIGFVAGADWSERAVGTTAPGIALEVGESVQVRLAEHYNSLVHPWSCTAAPVRDPETHHVLGVIDISGGDIAASRQAQMLVDATARAVESELLVARLRERTSAVVSPPTRAETGTVRGILHVLGRDRALLETGTEHGERVIELSARHAAIMLMLAVHPHGLSAERLAELVYGEDASPDTLRPEMVRLRKVLERTACGLTPESRPYRLPMPLETDAHDVLSLLDRGAYRVALSAYRGPVLPESASPGVEEFREVVRTSLREAMISGAGLEVLLAYAETPEARDDVEVLWLALEMLPPRSPKRAGLVARIERLEADR